MKETSPGVKWTVIILLSMAIICIIVGKTIPNPSELVVVTTVLSIIFVVVAVIWVTLIYAIRFIRMIIKSVKASNPKLGILFIILGVFIPSILYPFSSLTREATGLSFLAMNKEFTYQPNFRDLETVFAVPYKYAIAFGVIFVFLGITILAFSDKKQEWGFERARRKDNDG